MSQSRYFSNIRGVVWFLQDKGFNESTEKARAAGKTLREHLVLLLDLAGL